MTNRQSDEKTADHLYVSESPFGDGICTYCGDLADTWDHVLPLSMAAALYEQITTDRAVWPPALKLVPCCRDCNSRLGTAFARSITEKRKILLKKLQKRFKRELMSTDWGNDEISDLGPNLRQYIRTSEARRKHIEERVNFAKSNGRSA